MLTSTFKYHRAALPATRPSIEGPRQGWPHGRQGTRSAAKNPVRADNDAVGSDNASVASEDAGVFSLTNLYRRATQSSLVGTSSFATRTSSFSPRTSPSSCSTPSFRRQRCRLLSDAPVLRSDDLVSPSYALVRVAHVLVHHPEHLVPIIDGVVFPRTLSFSPKRIRIARRGARSAERSARAAANAAHGMSASLRRQRYTSRVPQRHAHTLFTSTCKPFKSTNCDR